MKAHAARTSANPNPIGSESRARAAQRKGQGNRAPTGTCTHGCLSPPGRGCSALAAAAGRGQQHRAPPATRLREILFSCGIPAPGTAPCHPPRQIYEGPLCAHQMSAPQHPAGLQSSLARPKRSGCSRPGGRSRVRAPEGPQPSPGTLGGSGVRGRGEQGTESPGLCRTEPSWSAWCFPVTNPRVSHAFARPQLQSFPPAPPSKLSLY